MGMPKLFSAGSTSYCDQPITQNSDTTPNPNPYKFTIHDMRIIGEFILIVANYPDCTTYGGDKIMVYSKDDFDEVKDMIEMKNLDPHFLDVNVEPSPVARFPGSFDGLKLAIRFLRAVE